MLLGWVFLVGFLDFWEVLLDFLAFYVISLIVVINLFCRSPPSLIFMFFFFLLGFSPECLKEVEK